MGRVFNSKLGRIVLLRRKCMAIIRQLVENSAQVLSCQLKFVYVLSDAPNCGVTYTIVMIIVICFSTGACTLKLFTAVIYGFS